MHYGDIYRKKKRIMARLKGIQFSRNYPTSAFLQNLETRLQNDYNDILRIEDDYWKLRTRISWIQEGDTNIKFFHIAATNKSRKNKIIYFKDDLGNWINEPAQILQHTLVFFQYMFKTDHTSTNCLGIRNNPQSFTNIDLTILDKQLSPAEVVNAIFSFKPFKSPGPDDIHPFSYLKILGHSRSIRY